MVVPLSSQLIFQTSKHLDITIIPKNLDDLDSVLNWVETTYVNHPHIDASNIILVGHSRGGGIVTLKAAEDSRVKKLVSLAGVSDFKSRFPKGSDLEAWKSERRSFCYKWTHKTADASLLSIL